MNTVLKNWIQKSLKFHALGQIKDPWQREGRVWSNDPMQEWKTNKQKKQWFRQKAEEPVQQRRYKKQGIKKRNLKMEEII